MRLSSKSDHHEGYAFVLAYISVTCEVDCRSALPDLDLAFELRLVCGIYTAVVEDIGSIWTMSSHVWTMAFIKEVFPAPSPSKQNAKPQSVIQTYPSPQL